MYKINEFFFLKLVRTG